MLPTIGLNSYNFYRVSGAVLSGNIADFLFPMKLKFSTTATAGTLAFQRGNQVPGTSITLPFVGIRTFKINSNVTDSRFFIGYSNLYKTSNPTNIDLTTQTQSIGVCKIDTSDNLHFTYNDDSGLATLEDLGVDYPAKNTIDYKYKLIIESTTGSNFILTLVRIDSSGVEISTTSTPISNIPTAVMNAALWITNNATATIASLFDLGLVHIIKNY